MSLTKKHFIHFAKWIRESLVLRDIKKESPEHFKDMVLELCDYFAAENKSFDRERFLSVCGIKEAV